MNTPAPILAASTIEAFRASIMLGVGRLLALFLDLGEAHLPPWLKRVIRDRVWVFEKHAQVVLFLLAGQRRQRIALPARTRTPRGGSYGFRLKTTRGSALRRFTRTALRGAGRGTLAERMHRLIDALTHPEPHIARCLKHMARGLQRTRLVACAPVAVVLMSLEPANVALADSS